MLWILSHEKLTPVTANYRKILHLKWKGWRCYWRRTQPAGILKDSKNVRCSRVNKSLSSKKKKDFTEHPYSFILFMVL